MCSASILLIIQHFFVPRVSHGHPKFIPDLVEMCFGALADRINFRIAMFLVNRDEFRSELQANYSESDFAILVHIPLPKRKGLRALLPGILKKHFGLTTRQDRPALGLMGAAHFS